MTQTLDHRKYRIISDVSDLPGSLVLFLRRVLVSKASMKATKTKNSVFAKNLKNLLQERGLSQRAVAELASVRPSVVNDWLAGCRPTKMEPVVALCQALKIDFQYLLTGTRSILHRDDLSLNDLFDIEEEPNFSGLFLIEAKRLRRKKSR